MSTGAAVNVPTNKAIKERDVNSKLQLYGIYSGSFFFEPHKISTQANLK